MKLSREAIAKKLEEIAKETHSRPLADESGFFPISFSDPYDFYSMEAASDLARIIARSDVRRIVTSFFEEYPRHQAITDSILKYQGKRVVLEEVVKYVFFDLFKNGTFDSARETAEILGQDLVYKTLSSYGGTDARTIMNNLGEIARHIRKAGLIRQIAKEIPKYGKGENLNYLMKSLADVAYRTKSDDVVMKVANFASKYHKEKVGSGFRYVVDTVFEISDMISGENPSHREIMATLNLASSYAAQALKHTGQKRASLLRRMHEVIKDASSYLGDLKAGGSGNFMKYLLENSL